MFIKSMLNRKIVLITNEMVPVEEVFLWRIISFSPSFLPSKYLRSYWNSMNQYFIDTCTHLYTQTHVQSYFTSCDIQNLSPASAPLTVGKGKNPSPSPRVCISLSERWVTAIGPICCHVLGFALSFQIESLNSFFEVSWQRVLFWTWEMWSRMFYKKIKYVLIFSVLIYFLWIDQNIYFYN